MTQFVKIITDSTNDLTEDLLRENHVDVIPLYAVLGDESLKDGVEIGADELLKWSDEHKTTPKTAAVSVQDFIDAFTPYVEAGTPIVYIGLSSGISSTIQNANLAASSFDDADIQVVDSLNLSSGIGYLVLEAARMSREGMAAAAIKAELEDMVPRINVTFVLDTLEYLHRGGRCTTLQFLGANMLSLKPEIVVRDGKMTTNRKYRGTIGRALDRYVQDHLAEGEKIDPRRIIVTYSRMDEATVQKVVDACCAAGYFDEVLTTQAGCVISSHCGPNCLGVIYMNRK